MRFLCISFLSPPGIDAESACTGRFLSALVNAGHEVKLISLDHGHANRHLDSDIANELLDKRISVVRIPLRSESNFMRHLAQIRHGLIDIGLEYVNDAVKLVKEDLCCHPGTILISRSAWPSSNVVGWKCRKYAKMWIPHFSDPFPSYKKMRPKAYWKYPLSYLWMLRFLRDSTFITVTCHNAIRYFDEITGRRFHEKFHIAYHIGFPRLESIGYSLPQSNQKQKTIVHVGELFKGRHAERFAEYCSKFTEIRFIQFGNVNNKQLYSEIEIHPISSPRMATDAMAGSDAVLVCDLDSGFGYSPYLPSKFAYAMALQKPIICLTVKDSEMARLSSILHGVYWVNIGKPFDENTDQLLSNLIKGILRGPATVDGCLFSPSDVVEKFENRINKLLSK